MEEKIDLAKRLEKLALKDPRITKSDGASYRESEGEIVIANSNGLLKSYRSSGCGYGVSVVAEKGEQKSSGSDSCSRRFYGDLKPAEEVAAKAAREAYETLDPRPVKTQRAAVIFHADVSRALLGGILGAVDGERVLQGASFLAKKMDQKIGSELITIVDDGTREKGMASEPFDGEGVPTQKRVIVDKGVLKGFLYNTSVAKRAGVRSTGNASRGGFGSLPGIGPHNFFMAAGGGQAGGHHRGHQDGAPGQRRHGLRDQSGQRQLQRRRVRILDRERQDRLSREGPDDRRDGRGDPQRHRHGRRRPGYEPVDGRPDAPRPAPPDRRGIAAPMPQPLHTEQQHRAILLSIAQRAMQREGLATRLFGRGARRTRQDPGPSERAWRVRGRSLGDPRSDRAPLGFH